MAQRDVGRLSVVANVRSPFLSARDADIFHHECFEPQSIEALRRSFVSAYPWPHLVIDNLFEQRFLGRLDVEFSQVGSEDWLVHKDTRQFKFGTRSGVWLPPALQTYFDAVNSGPFVRFLSAVTGIDALITDTQLTNGGLHQILPGGHFAMHIDNQRHPITFLNTRLTAITYLNPGWRSEFGGGLSLREIGAPSGVLIQPTFGRTVIFLNSGTSLHGHPDPVVGPKTLRRRSLATYYYTNDDPASPDAADQETTFVEDRAARARRWAQMAWKQLAPPIVATGVNIVRKKWAGRSFAQR